MAHANTYAKNTSEIMFADAELKFFNFFESKKTDFDVYRPHPENFLGMMAPHRIDMLRKILKKIEFQFDGYFVVDLLMPGGTAGYFAPSVNMIAINPWLLLEGSEKDIAHVLFHESLHAGVDGPPIMDEAVVETMTIKRIEELYGEDKFPTGYADLVSDVTEYFGEMSFQQMSEQIEDGDEETLNNLLQFMVIEPAFEEGTVDALSWSKIEKRLKRKWETIEHLFPRLINSVADNNKGLHERGDMSFSDYKLEGLLQVAADRILDKRKDLFIDALLKVTNSGKTNMNPKDILQGLIDEGFMYIYDANPGLIDKVIQAYIRHFLIIEMNAQSDEARESINATKLVYLFYT